MPSFEDIEISASAAINFEVFCAECGEGLCGISDTRKSRNRGEAQVTVGSCPKCKDTTECPLLNRIAELEHLLAEAIEKSQA